MRIKEFMMRRARHGLSMGDIDADERPINWYIRDNVLWCQRGWADGENMAVALNGDKPGRGVFPGLCFDGGGSESPDIEIAMLVSLHVSPVNHHKWGRYRTLAPITFTYLDDAMAEGD